MHDLYVDIGAATKKAAMRRVSIGDPMTFVDSFEMLTPEVAVARGMDNRTGTWVAIEALRLAKARKPKCAIYACSSIQEESAYRARGCRSSARSPMLQLLWTLPSQRIHRESTRSSMAK